MTSLHREGVATAPKQGCVEGQGMQKGVGIAKYALVLVKYCNTFFSPGRVAYLRLQQVLVMVEHNDQMKHEQRS